MSYYRSRNIPIYESIFVEDETETPEPMDMGSPEPESELEPELEPVSPEPELGMEPDLGMPMDTEEPEPSEAEKEAEKESELELNTKTSNLMTEIADVISEATAAYQQQVLGAAIDHLSSASYPPEELKEILRNIPEVMIKVIQDGKKYGLFDRDYIAFVALMRSAQEIQDTMKHSKKKRSKTGKPEEIEESINPRELTPLLTESRRRPGESAISQELREATGSVSNLDRFSSVFNAPDFREFQDGSQEMLEQVGSVESLKESGLNIKPVDSGKGGWGDTLDNYL